MTMQNLFVAIGLSAALATGAAQAGQVVVTAAGEIATSNNTNWVSHGLATLGGVTSGVDWTVSGENQNSVWTYQGDNGQTALSSPSLEWHTPGNFANFGFTLGTQGMGIGPNMNADVVAGGGILVISEVAPAAGDYTLNGITQTATAVGSILQWDATSAGGNLANGNTLAYTSTVADPNGSANTVANGPIGFSAVPEPASFVLFGLGAIGLFVAARRRRKV